MSVGEEPVQIPDEHNILGWPNYLCITESLQSGSCSYYHLQLPFLPHIFKFCHISDIIGFNVFVNATLNKGQSLLGCDAMLIINVYPTNAPCRWKSPSYGVSL